MNDSERAIEELRNIKVYLEDCKGDSQAIDIMWLKSFDIAIRALHAQSEADEEREEISYALSKILKKSNDLLQKIESRPNPQLEAERKIEKVREYCKAHEPTINNMVDIKDILEILEGKADERE